jgi:hypothetical protein
MKKTKFPATHERRERLFESVMDELEFRDRVLVSFCEPSRMDPAFDCDSGSSRTNVVNVIISELFCVV